MENRSRVERYKDLRRKIENMDRYSFTETASAKRNLPQHGSLEVPLVNKGITKNTLNMSIDELIHDHDAYAEEQKKKEIKEKYRQEKRKTFHMEKSDVLRLVLFLAIGLILIVAIALIVLLATEVI